jgi:Carboxypeptidase regulatory-like domain
MDSSHGGRSSGISGSSVASFQTEAPSFCRIATLESVRERNRGVMLVAAASLVSAVSSPVAAQSGAVLSGNVHDSTGIPLPGVVVTVIDPVHAETRVVVTNQRGAYFLDRLHYGREYAVHVSHPRFRKSRVRASASEGDRSVDITLLSRRTRFARAILFPLHVLSLGLIGNGS